MAARKTAPVPATAMKGDTSWFVHDRFGMFIHWGLYAVPAGQWKGKPVGGIHHVFRDLGTPGRMRQAALEHHPGRLFLERPLNQGGGQQAPCHQASAAR